jgi:fibro-slime domain-containing protein
MVYNYNNDNFFPLNGKGFGNSYDNKNYGFTLASNLRFTYQGFETFSFTGDDDVWVYINDFLALDLGGVHGALSGTLDLTYPSDGCDHYTFDRSNPPLPCHSGSSVPCACLLSISPGT